MCKHPCLTQKKVFRFAAVSRHSPPEKVDPRKKVDPDLYSDKHKYQNARLKIVFNIKDELLVLA